MLRGYPILEMGYKQMKSQSQKYKYECARLGVAHPAENRSPPPSMMRASTNSATSAHVFQKLDFKNQR